MNFGLALKVLQDGAKVRRAGWNGKDMYIYLQAGYTDDETDECVDPCIALFTANRRHQPGWLASQADMLADDWEVLCPRCDGHGRLSPALDGHSPTQTTVCAHCKGEGAIEYVEWDYIQPAARCVNCSNGGPTCRSHPACPGYKPA